MALSLTGTARTGKDGIYAMREITEQQISALAPNAAAAANGRKISQKGGFVRLEQSADDTFYLGECTGSGKSNYITSADFLDPAQPVFRCSCPSRQFPCKHSLALLYEMMAGKDFKTCDIPEDILEKRAKKENRAAKAAVKAPDAEGAKAPPKVNKAARTKKLKKQLEGLELTAKLVGDLMNAGLGTMGGTALKTYRDLAKQLGDYYLPGPQRLLNRLILEIGAFQKDGADAHYDEAVAVLEKLWALVRKSKTYLTEKLEQDEVGQDDNLLFEELGGVWKLDDLAALGLAKPDVRLAQLAFWVGFDEARGEYIDTGCWADLETGEISLTYNYRPLKALKYVKQDDTVFGVAHIPLAAYYPGEGNRRVRWEGAVIGPLEAEALARLRGQAKALAPEIKAAKGLLKNTLSGPAVYTLLSYKRIGRCGNGFALEDGAGSTVMLGDLPGLEPTTVRLPLLPDPALLEDQTLLGAIWYDRPERRIKVQPLSIITPGQVVRLLY